MKKKITQAQEEELKRREEKAKNPPSISRSNLVSAVDLFNQGAEPETIEVKTGVTITDIQALHDIGERIKPVSEQIRDILANQWYMVAEAALQELGRRDLSRVPAKDLATLAGIAQDKAQQMEGKPKEVIAAFMAVMEKIMIDETEYTRKYAGIIKVNGDQPLQIVGEKAGL